MKGGKPGALAHSRILRSDGTVKVIPSKLLTTVKAGERLIIETAGGGGYGPPSARDSSAVQTDLRDGKVSAQTARQIYGHEPDP